ncbi:MAG TPA: type II toxin-antitoxin system HicB family antitoxin [Solirubrobacteraceae bacterium]|jgi:Arc/MetJ-type ribon-helix-helix transcriptional regulator
MARVLISMPDELLERIDRQVQQAGGSRSGFLQEAALRQLGWPDPAIFDAALARGRAALGDADEFESAQLIRADRDARDAADQRRR